MSAPPTECPYYLITRVSLALTSLLKKELASEGVESVKPAYLGVLMCLWLEEGMGEILGKLGRDEGMKLTELGRCAGLEPSTMTGLIDRMERDELVYRSDDPADRRAQKINLSAKGIHVHDPVIGAVDSMLKKAFEGIAPDQIETAKRVMREVYRNVNEGSR